jgi:hypothetical protein
MLSRCQSFEAPALCQEPWVARCIARLILILLIATRLAFAQGGRQASPGISDISGEYHFLAPDDTLGLLEEEGKVKGFVEVFQGEEESDTILSFPITIGSRAGDRVEFKTAKIHEKYYRFSGTVERGKGREPKDADYLRLVGEVEMITVNSEDGKEAVERRSVIFKSLSAEEKAEREEE